MNTGRPRKYKTVASFDAKVEEYIQHCRDEQEPITWTGLALYLGFASRASIDEYAKYEGFSYSIKRAKLIVENSYEKRLHGNNPTGAIFALKNYGWSDRHEVTGPDGERLTIEVEYVGKNTAKNT